MPGEELLVVPPARALRPGTADAERFRLAAAAVSYAEAASAASTRRAYGSAWRAFCGWCDRLEEQAMPASAAAVMGYITDLAEAGRSVRTLNVHLAAIRKAHEHFKKPPPASPELTKVWAGIRRKRGAPPNRKRPLITKDLRKAIGKLPDDRSGLRDRALLLLQFAAALRRSELSRLWLNPGRDDRDTNRVEFVDAGVLIRIGQSKTDQFRAGQTVAVPFGASQACPVTALRAWLAAAEITDGPVFRSVDRHGKVGEGPLDGGSIARIVKRSVARAGLDPSLFSGHSPRAGLVTSAAAAKVPLQTIMRTTRHTKPDTVLGYIREAAIFEDNASGKLL